VNIPICQKVAETRPWQPHEKEALKRLVYYGLKKRPCVVRCYYEAQGTLAMHTQNIDWPETARIELEILELFMAGQEDAALDLMAEKLRLGIEKYWPDCPLDSYRELKQLAELPKQ
jgi:hypothetical protein